MNTLYNQWCMDADQSEMTQQQTPGVAGLDTDFQLNFRSSKCMCWP